MYTKELFNETVAILANAYMKDLLVAGNCCACAVGNIIASRKGYQFTEDVPKNIQKPQWLNVPYPGGNPETGIGWGAAFCTTLGSQIINERMLQNEVVIDQIKSTGYDWLDLAKIEYAFELSNLRPSVDSDHMFNGLMAVVDVLCEIHGMNETEKQESKALFVKA